MTKLTADEIRRKIAELKGWKWFYYGATGEGEPRMFEPTCVAFDECAAPEEILPIHLRSVPNYLTDTAAAMALFDELPKPREIREVIFNGCLRVIVKYAVDAIKNGDDITESWRAASDRNTAICLAWLEWKCGERFELVEDKCN
jgi:hypothetical protein